MKKVASLILCILFGMLMGWFGHSYFGTQGLQFQFNDAAGRGEVEDMERLISLGADPLGCPYFREARVYGAPAIHVAASEGEPESIEFLLGKGADPNTLVATETPLDLAIHRRDEAQRAVGILRKSGAKTFSELGKN